MTNEEAINILANCIDDYVIGDFCVGKFCPMEDECKDKECVFHEAIETVLNIIQKQQHIIDLMADNIYEDDSNLGYYLCRKNGKCTKEMIIDYFKRKVEDK